MKQANRKTWCIAILTLLPLNSLRPGVRAQDSMGSQASSTKSLETRVPEFELRNETLLDGLWKLARGPVPFGFGFEKVLKESLSDPDLPDTALVLKFENKSIREILDALCNADPRYAWSVDGTTVDVFPRSIRNDRFYLLNRELPRLELKNATDVQHGLLAIVRQLPPPVEQIAQAQAGGDDPYPPEPWTVTFENVTVRQVVNRLAEHGGPYGIWIFGGSKDFRAFGFFNTHPSPWLLKPRVSGARNAQSFTTKPSDRVTYGCAGCCGYTQTQLSFNPLGISLLSTSPNGVDGYSTCDGWWDQADDGYCAHQKALSRNAALDLRFT